MVVRENMEFHLNVNVHRREVRSRNAHDGRTLEKEILFPKFKRRAESFLTDDSLVQFAIRVSCDTGSLKKTRCKDRYSFYIHTSESTNTRITAGCRKCDVADWTTCVTHEYYDFNYLPLAKVENSTSTR